MVNITKPTVGATGWNTAVDALIDKMNTLSSASLSDFATAVAALITGKANLKGQDTNLGAGSEYNTHLRILDDGSATTNWPNRFSIAYAPVSGTGEHLTSWFNEYGEFRCTPGKSNTIGFRVYVGDLPADYTARDNTVASMELVSDRTNRTPLFQVFKDGRAFFAGQVTAASAALTGALTASSATLTGVLSAASATLTGALSAASATLTGALTANSAAITNGVTAATVTATGAVSGGSVSTGGTVTGATVTSTGAVNGATGSFSGAVAASNVAQKVRTVPTGTTGFASEPDGTYWVEYTP